MKPRATETPTAAGVPKDLPRRRPTVRRLATLACLGACLGWATDGGVAQQPVLPPGTGTPRGLQTVPGPAYDAALESLSRGDYSQALEIAGREYRGGIRVGSRRWLDSAAIAAVVGESEYELGRFREAVAAYDETLLLIAQNADWLLAVRFPSGVPEPAARPRVATWRKSERATRPANLPATALIQLSGSDPQDVLQKGGLLSAAFSTTLRPEEIMRALVMSLYRRTEILGGLARDSTAFREVLAALQRRPAPPNHHSQAWVDVALGTALWSQGKPQQAAPLLERGLLVGPGLDHGLTGWGLVVLGRIALDAGNPAGAARLFDEAACAAAEARDARALEEAFRWAFAAHMAAGAETVPASIAAATDWARGDLPVVRARLLAAQAEVLAGSNPQAAAARLKAIDQRFLAGDAGRGAVGALVAYAAGLVALAGGDAAAGSADLERAVAIGRQRSPRLHQTALVVDRIVGGGDGLSDRQAEELLAQLLSDPAPRDFTIDPLAALVVVTTPRQPAFDAWLAVAGRRGADSFLAASDAAARARWSVLQPFGGRRLAIDRLLDADPARLDAAAAARRAALLARHPDLVRLLDDTRAIRARLSAALAEAAGRPAGADPAPPRGVADAALPGDDDDWRAFRAASERRRTRVDQIAAGRDPTVFDFPPPARADLRQRLRPREMILSFHWTRTGLFGALESRDRVALWQVAQPAAVQREIGDLLRGIGLFGNAAPVSTTHLAAEEWRTPATNLERLLFEASRIALGAGIDDLVIVPDGPLWYLPFELLPVGSDDADAPRPLREVCRIRTCPTRGLALSDTAAAATPGPIGIHIGKRWRGDRPGDGVRVASRLERCVARAVAFPGGVTAETSALAAALCETFVVFDELPIDSPVGARPLLAGGPDRAAATVSFTDWLGAPAKRPGCLILADVETAAVGATAAGRGGEELFEATTDLLAAGARRGLVSRWRMAGATSIDLIGEFLLALDESSPAGSDHPAAPGAASWRRAVDIVSREVPDGTAEPRIRQDAEHPLVDSSAPLLWAGYLLVEPGEPHPPGAAPQGAR